MATSAWLRPGRPTTYCARSCSSRPSISSLVRLLIGLIALTSRTESEKDAEILALRHEVAVLAESLRNLDDSAGLFAHHTSHGANTGSPTAK